MKLLVTGGAGFIGSNFIRYWFTHHPDDAVINLDKLTYAGNLENLKDIESKPGYKFVLGDITNHDLVESLLDQCDVVVHFAAESHVDRSILDADDFVRTNVVGTQVILEAVKKLDKKLHYISTDEVFGALTLKSKKKFNEKTRYNPSSPYAASKAAADHLVRAFYHTYDIDVTITNCSNNFGPYQFPEKLIPLAITNVLEGKKVPVYGDGKYVRDWVYVEDHCRAIDLVLNKGSIGETYCIGGMTQDVSNLEVVRKILALLGKDDSAIEFVKDRPGHDRRYAIDWSLAHKELGYEPAFDFDTYIAKTVKWYQENQAWWQKVRSGEYQAYYERQYGKAQG